MRYKLVEFNENQYDLSNSLIRSEYKDSIDLIAGKIFVEIDIEAQNDSSKEQTDGVCSEDQFDLFFSLIDEPIADGLEESRNKLVGGLQLYLLFGFFRHSFEYFKAIKEGRDQKKYLNSKTYYAYLNQIIFTAIYND